MPVTLTFTFHFQEHTVTIQVKCDNRHSGK